MNYELLKNNLPPIVIEKDGRAQYFKMLADYDVKELSRFFQERNEMEQERIRHFEEVPVAEEKQSFATEEMLLDRTDLD